MQGRSYARKWFLFHVGRRRRHLSSLAHRTGGRWNQIKRQGRLEAREELFCDKGQVDAGLKHHGSQYHRQNGTNKRNRLSFRSDGLRGTELVYEDEGRRQSGRAQ